MTRPVFGETDSPRLARQKAQRAEREERLLQRDRPFLSMLERGPDGMPTRIVFARNPNYTPRRAASSGEGGRGG